MAIELQMPKIGLTMTEGKVVEWRKKVGERVESGEVLFVFETEKTTFDVEAPRSGVLVRIDVDVDETVPVGAVVGLLADREGEPAQAAPPGREPPRESPADVAASPAAREGRLVRPSAMRRVIAERMLASKRDTAQAYMTASFDATGLLATKDALAEDVEQETGARLTLADLLVKLAAAAVAAHPEINTRWTPEGILFLDDVHVGLATALDDGLVVPVIRHAGRRTLAEIAAERTRLVERGRSGRLTPDETRGGTFTLSSLGMFGVEEFTAILNPPESAILAVGAILDAPVVVEKRIVVRPVMKVTLTYDHRVFDGASAAKFLRTLRGLVENPVSVVT